MSIIHLEGATLRQLLSPEGRREALAVFRRNLDTLRRTNALDETQVREWERSLQEFAGRSLCISSQESMPSSLLQTTQQDLEHGQPSQLPSPE